MSIQWNSLLKRPNGSAGQALRWPWFTPAPIHPKPLNNSFGAYQSQRPAGGPAGTMLGAYPTTPGSAATTNSTGWRSLVEGTQRVTI